MAQLIDDSKVPRGPMSACMSRIHERGDYWCDSYCPYVRICVLKTLKALNESKAWL
jgi:hypothetical protein